MGKFNYYRIKRPQKTDKDEEVIIFENLIDDIQAVQILVRNQIIDLVILHPFQKFYYSIPDNYLGEKLIVL
ncbi:hypothetical protein [Streptococcus phocae]|uniref:Uncharacterized protein n=1 Tax=Streptococcus phocae TaxID=119224 RepID=A0A0P6S993_9STRE|nr:hypothetical protein [Streptococcus phocae]KPJ23176.1 hypothetical protein AKK44_00700 [Streptococcus phocae]